MAKMTRVFLWSVISFSLIGCATIVGDSAQLVPISSSPSGATVLIKDETNSELYSGATPTTVPLKKSDGSYFGGKSYTVVVSKPGYQTQTIPIKAGVNGWYVGGNFIFGGLIGWLIVDPLNGGMYTLSPGTVHASLSSGETAHNNTATDGSISIVLIEDVPQMLLDQMNRIN